MELLLHQWGDWPELYRNTDKTEATEIVIIDSQMNYRGKLDTYCGVRLLLEYRLHTMRAPLCPTVVPQAVDNSRLFVGKINPHEIWDSSFFRVNLSTHEFDKKIPTLCKKRRGFFY